MNICTQCTSKLEYVAELPPSTRPPKPGVAQMFFESSLWYTLSASFLHVVCTLQPIMLFTFVIVFQIVLLPTWWPLNQTIPWNMLSSTIFPCHAESAGEVNIFHVIVSQTLNDIVTVSYSCCILNFPLSSVIRSARSCPWCPGSINGSWRGCGGDICHGSARCRAISTYLFVHQWSEM